MKRRQLLACAIFLLVIVVLMATFTSCCEKQTFTQAPISSQNANPVMIIFYNHVNAGGQRVEYTLSEVQDIINNEREVQLPTTIRASSIELLDPALVVTATTTDGKSVRFTKSVSDFTKYSSLNDQNNVNDKIRSFTVSTSKMLGQAVLPDTLTYMTSFVITSSTPTAVTGKYMRNIATVTSSVAPQYGNLLDIVTNSTGMFRTYPSLYTKRDNSGFNDYVGNTVTIYDTNKRYMGEYFQLELSEPVNIKSYNLGVTNYDTPGSWMVFGSNNKNGPWSKLDERQIKLSQGIYSYDIRTNNKYTFYRIAINKTYSSRPEYFQTTVYLTTLLFES